MKADLICIIGPDGVGKSTQAKLLIKKLKKEGFDCKYKWLRFYHLFSLPLLAVARLMGLSEVKTLHNGDKIGYHYFWKSKIISMLYPISLLIDTILVVIIKIYFPIKIFKKKIICDRFVYDTIVDLMISTGNVDFYKTNIGKYFISLIPVNSMIVMLLGNEKMLRKRREDLKHDKILGLKIQYYKKLANEFNIETIETSLSVKEVHDLLLDLIY